MKAEIQEHAFFRSLLKRRRRSVAFSVCASCQIRLASKRIGLVVQTPDGLVVQSIPLARWRGSLHPVRCMHLSRLPRVMLVLSEMAAPSLYLQELNGSFVKQAQLTYYSHYRPQKLIFTLVGHLFAFLQHPFHQSGRAFVCEASPVCTHVVVHKNCRACMGISQIVRDVFVQSCGLFVGLLASLVSQQHASLGDLARGSNAGDCPRRKSHMATFPGSRTTSVQNMVQFVEDELPSPVDLDECSPVSAGNISKWQKDGQNIHPSLQRGLSPARHSQNTCAADFKHRGQVCT